ncbi:unnamed protein product [Hymenolepis diminuta]|uniref:Junctophilin n=2 Tax=Hymenolepis diminuta TaxID=6216 RepID=A0A564ZCQ6_HYMDI|nr:unnamed protein product [Hymenolepis diminuta]
MATAEGGRFDFDDGGSYVGEWCENRAHGFGIATGPDNQGEYSGEWNMGFESRGVYVWPSGNLYAGGWLKGKRHGEGVQIKGRWIYRGAFTSGFYGRYGVKESLTTCARYEGSWHLNQFDGFGVETNSDGSIYAGAWSKGMRQGLGVRKSAPWGLAAEHHSTVRAAQSQSSLPSTHDSDRGGWRGPGSSGDSAGSADHLHGGRYETFRSGFVLKATSYPPGSTPPPSRSQSAAPFRSSSTDKRNSIKRFILKKLRKPKSTGDLSSVGPHTISGTGSAGSGRFGLHAPRAGGSLRSNISGATANSMFVEHQSRIDGAGVLMDNLDEPLGPNVTETYSGQWNEDRRSGYGVAERSDGLRYEGEWFNNKKDGYGVTCHPDGSREEGRYKENILVQPLMKRTKLYLLRHSKLKDNVEEAVRKAREAAKEAQEKSAETAHQRAQTARSVAKTAETRAEEAKNISDQARAIATEFASDFMQMGVQWERNNPFAHMITRGGTPSATAQVNSNGVTMRPANTHNLFVNSLEVSGGNRRGSFRSSFKRSTSGTLNESNLDGPRMQDFTDSEMRPEEMKVQLAPVPQRVQQFATVQNLEETQFETLGGPIATTLSPSPQTTAPKKPPILHTAQVVLSNDPQVHTATLEFISSVSKSPPPITEQRVSQGRPAVRAATSGATGPPPLSAFDLMKSGKIPLTATEKKMTRRRTLPSILTTPPSGVTTPQGSSKMATLQRPGTGLSPASPASALGNPAGDKHFAMPGLSSNLDDVHHSTEDLVETYIIEDGVKKRVQPTRASDAGALLGKGNVSGAAGTLRRGRAVSPDRRFKVGDEARRLAGGTGADFDTGELLPLPDAYKIESVGNLLGGGLETSMPDVSKGVEGMLLSKGGPGAPRLGIGGFLTRDEVCRLGQQRRHELLLDRERKKRGEIIIRLADIKDWLCANIVVVLVLLFNLCLAFLFINLINNAGKMGPQTGQVAELTPEEKRAAASAAAEAVQKALRAANAASRSTPSVPPRPPRT